MVHRRQPGHQHWLKQRGWLTGEGGWSICVPSQRLRGGVHTAAPPRGANVRALAKPREAPRARADAPASGEASSPADAAPASARAQGGRGREKDATSFARARNHHRTPRSTHPRRAHMHPRTPHTTQPLHCAELRHSRRTAKRARTTCAPASPAPTDGSFTPAMAACMMRWACSRSGGATSRVVVYTLPVDAGAEQTQ
jgi:hypothetical protein